MRHTEAAAYLTNDRFAISVVDESGTEWGAASICANDASTAEELGIALAIATCRDTRDTMITVSHEASRRYMNGQIGNAAPHDL